VKVLFLQRQPCIRALKYAVGLRSAEADLTLGFAYQGGTLDEWYGAGDDLFDAWWRLPPYGPDELAAVVEAFLPDVIHSHNLPDTLTAEALALGPGRPPVLHDVHDMQSLRHTPYEDGFDDPEDPLALERRALEGADALVVVSEEMREEIAAAYPAAPRHLVFPNYALARDLPRELPPAGRPPGRPLRLVYEGSLSTNGGHYDLREGFLAAASEGLEVHVHPNREVPAYRELADATPELVVHERLAPDALMAVLPRYDMGWAVFNAALNRRHLDTALPNKAFEYLGAGLPVLAGDHRALANLVRERGVGIAVDGLGGLRGRLEGLDVPALRARVAAIRGEITVESAIDGLLAVYEALAGARPSRALVRH
jgi:glycosyltransferase involved in cell wall biosynthesis